jgi:hypothetical protein
MSPEQQALIRKAQQSLGAARLYTRQSPLAAVPKPVNGGHGHVQRDPPLLGYPKPEGGPAHAPLGTRRRGSA